MKNYVCINNEKTELTEEQLQRIRDILGMNKAKLAEVDVGEVVRIGQHELIVLEQSGEVTALVRKEDIFDGKAFGKNNNYDGSHADELCNGFAYEIMSLVGEENIVKHEVDLMTHDGLKDYGVISRLASAMTIDRYRQYVEILDFYKIDRYYWLATAFSAKKHDGDRWVLCVAPSGFVGDYVYVNDDSGVRPFCILKSSIFVSK